MNDYITEITLDLNCAKTPVTINSAQFDKGRKLKVNITADGNSFDVSDCTAILKGIRANKTHLAIECEVDNDSVVVTFKDTDLSVKGFTIVRIVLSDGTRTYSTQMCIIDVSSSLEGDITYSDTYSILNRLIEQIYVLNESGGILVDDQLNKESKNPIQNAVVTKAIDETVQRLEQYDLSKKLDDKSGVIKSYHIADYAVSTAKLFDGAVTTEKIDDGAVGEEELNPELLEKINSKIDDSEGVIKTDHIADKAITKNKIQSGAVTSLHLAYDSVLEKAIAIGQVKERHIEDGNITKAKLSDEVVQLIDSKYDASNIETGTGVLSTQENRADKINSATFEYQKVGNWVDVHIYADLKAFSVLNNMSINLTGLPFICKNAVNPREMCVTNEKKQMLWAIGSGSASLTLLFFDTNPTIENEKLSFSLRYKIA